MKFQQDTPPLWVLRKSPHTSVSAVREYLTCPRRYFFRYVESVPPSFRAAAAAFGSSWHAVIQTWFSRPDVKLDELETSFREDFADRLRSDTAPVLFDGDETEEKLQSLAMKMIRAFVGKVQRPARVLGVEVPFSVDLSHPTTGEVLSVPLVGAVDAIVDDGADGAGTVIELKSAARRWSSDQLDYDLQLSAYKLVGRELIGRDARQRLLVTTKTIHPDVQAVDIVRHRVDVDEAVDVIFGVHSAIAAGADHRLRGWQCSGCPFFERCRA